ncbi:DUF2511 domain-containing protein [Flavobacterium beibuense]|uniref:DUF2511 domain containing protein n=1 Tax=Flavobacterium beibuense TaxID=657326 RepID=A0A444WFH6_9FLAO|nr:DUF2511 domain-containing protein [Flavobacterium beibuense]RYJ44542.1 DUF2511 domain containing protein [Flavobacterium beibuense]
MRNFTYFKILLLVSFAFLTSCSENTTKFTKNTFSGQWPFSVNEVEVFCRPYKEVYCKTEDGTIYALNGSAKSASRDDSKVKEIENIWLDNPQIPGTKIPYSDFISEGLKLCENK